MQHQDKIKEIGNLTNNDFLEIYELVIRNVKILNHSILPIQIYHRAKEICESIDTDDTIFVAFAEFIRGKIWTGDKKLIKGLTDQGYNRFINTDDLFQDYIKKSKKKK